MYHFVFYDKPLDRMKISQIAPLYYREASIEDYLSCRFLTKEESYGYTSLNFASSTANSRERQAQQMNYDNFIQIMAEMVQKYAGQIQV